MLKEWFADKYKSSIKDVNKMIHQIGYVESKNNPAARQRSHVRDEEGKKMKDKEGKYVFKKGPGGGKYQFENKKGSGAFQTALNRAENLYNKIGEDVPLWITNSKEHDDASKLTIEQQDSLLLADLAMKSGSDAFISEALNTGSSKSLWLNKHWAGADPGTDDFNKKGFQWDKEMETYGTPFKEEPAVQEIEALLKTT